jgi:hypothetical protein
MTNDNSIVVRSPTSIAKKGDQNDKTAIPCGFVRMDNYGTASLTETGKKFKSPADFAMNGEYYYPVAFHVSAACSCRFYT